MEKLQTAVGAVGIGITVAALFGVLFPNGNIKKAGETGLTVLLLFLILTPFLHTGEGEIHILREMEAYDAYTYTQTQVYKSAVETFIQDTLLNAGIPTQAVQAEIQCGDVGEIVLKNVLIAAKNETDATLLIKILQEQLGIPPEIVSVQGV